MRFFKKNKKTPNQKEILTSLKKLEAGLEKISEELNVLRRKNRFSIQKIATIRFNPFSGVGGNQSFTVALLDGEDSGVVITSLYTREGNRVYAKPVEKGKSEFVLSEEEKKTIEKAIGRDNMNKNKNEK